MPQCVQQAVGLLFTANSPAAKAALGILTEEARAIGRRLSDAEAPDFAEDGKWPPVPTVAIALVAGY